MQRYTVERLRKEEIDYFYLRTPSGAAVKVSWLWNNILFRPDVKKGKHASDISKAFAQKLRALEKNFGPEISEYQAENGFYCAEYPRVRAVVEYLAKEGLLEFNGEKAEIEDVGPSFKLPKLPSTPPKIGDLPGPIC